jgi:hypothetical protein
MGEGFCRQGQKEEKSTKFRGNGQDGNDKSIKISCENLL